MQKKGETTRIPLGGMGSGLERAYSKNISFYYYWLQYQKTELFTLFLVIGDPKVYKKLVTSWNKIIVVGEASRKLRFSQESENGQSILLFFVKPTNKEWAIKLKCAQKQFESVSGHHTNYQKKTK